MKLWIGGCCFLGAALFMAPALATGSNFEPVRTAPSAQMEEPVAQLEGKPEKVMCSYLHYGQTRFICGEPPMAEVKKKCDEKATEDRGEKAECACTSDANYIQGACD